MTMIALAGAKRSTSARFTSWIANPTRLPAAAGLLGGLAGGLAEAIWIGLYSATTGSDGFDIARRVADTVLPGILQTAAAPSIGLAIHFGLSAALGFILTQSLTSFIARRSAALLPICLGMLGLVWCVNFMLILPAINPIFPSLLPMWVTFASKLLFGAALAGVLYRLPAPQSSRTGR